MKTVPKTTVRTNRKVTAGVAGESELIARIVRALPARPGTGLRNGVGDDAAVVRAGRGLEWVVSSDALIEGVHFVAETQPAESVGYKALARATSDLGAMGARPRYFLLNLAL